jgi:Ca2+/H+ antiporter
MTTILSAGLLVVSLIAIGLAKILTPTVERGIAYLDVPKAVVGIIIATLVLLPEKRRRNWRKIRNSADRKEKPNRAKPR